MKNIHILSTDKPSKLYLGDNGNFVFGLIQGSIKSKNNNYTNFGNMCMFFITNEYKLVNFLLNFLILLSSTDIQIL